MDKEDFFDLLKEQGLAGEKMYSDDGSLYVDLPDEESWRQAQLILEDEDDQLNLQDANADTSGSSDYYDFCRENDYVLVTLRCYYRTPEEDEKYKLIIEDI